MDPYSPNLEFSTDFESVVATAELSHRPQRPVDHEAESRALLRISQSFLHSPQGVLQSLADAALDACHADTAGISMIEDDHGKRVIRWRALAGAFASQLSVATAPRHSSPSEVVLERRSATLFRQLHRYYTEFALAVPLIAEALLVPFNAGGPEPVGAVWLVTHDEKRQFDFEDARLAKNLAEFAGAAFSVLSSRDAAIQARNDAMKETHQLRTSAERTQTALDAAGLGTWEVDLAAGEVASSPGFKANLGLMPDAPLSYDSWSESIHPDDRSSVRTIVQRAVATQSNYEAEFRCFRPDGTTRWILARGRAIAGEPDRLVGVTLDITSRRQSEEALRDADRQKNEFLAILGHELRNPLSGMQYAVSFLGRRQSAQPDVSNAMSLLQRQLQNTKRLVDDLFEVSRINRGSMQLLVERVDLASPVIAAIESSRPLLETMRHELTVKLPPEPVFLDADPARVAQVVSNLLNNAAKYTPEGGHIELSARREDKEAVIRVVDDGIGIPKEMLNHIFEMFAQVTRPVRGSSRDGLGIGLGVVKQLVEMHGGKVAVRSAGLGKGSEFTVRLPIAE
jgi:PAS domain S-box-containing protein